jgi:SPP1 family phage portal protein
LHFQERITDSAVTFLFGNPVKLLLNSDDKDALISINDVWKQNKLDYFNKTIARDLFIECKAAELWYIPATLPAKIRVKILSKRTGYTFFPHYDDMGDMDAFTVLYDSKDDTGKTVSNANVYTAETIVRAVKTDKWDVVPSINLAGKIPVVYYEQKKPEWHSVKTQIERIEYLVSNFADTNDYFGAPVLQVKGRVAQLPKKEETGKIFEIAASINSNTGETTYPGGVEYITWDNAPEAIKQEFDMLKDIIYGMTQTPDVSFNNVKGLGAVSGIALRLMFSDALFKALNKQETFGPALERRLSIIKSMIALADSSQRTAMEQADIDIKFSDVLPQDIESLIRALSVARGGEAIMSEETAVRMNPLVTDSETEIEKLAGDNARLTSLAGSYGL